MLIASHTTEDCYKSFIDNGDCCCNCKHRYLLVTDDNFPLGYVCGVPFMQGELTFISENGHSMCECHERAFE